jgi:hypothetical protein
MGQLPVSPEIGTVEVSIHMEGNAVNRDLGQENALP